MHMLNSTQTVAEGYQSCLSVCQTYRPIYVASLSKTLPGNQFMAERDYTRRKNRIRATPLQKE